MSDCKWTVSEEKRKAFLTLLTETHVYKLLDLEARVMRSMTLMLSIKRNGPIKARCAKTIREAHDAYQRTVDEVLVFQATATRCTCNGECQKMIRDAFKEQFPLLSRKIDPKNIQWADESFGAS